MSLSKTQQAIELVTAGASVSAAAQAIGISAATLRVALWKRKGKSVCPCCGQIVREGFELREPAADRSLDSPVG